MAKRRVMLNYPTELHSEPIIYNIGQQFNVITNICQAQVTEDTAWIILELEGKDEDIEAGISWAISKGLRVDAVGTDNQDSTCSNPHR